MLFLPRCTDRSDLTTTVVPLVIRAALALLWATGSHTHLGTVSVRLLRYLRMHWRQPQTLSIAVRLLRHEHKRVFGCHNQSSSPDFTSFSSCASLTTSFCIRFSSRAPDGNYQHRLTPLRTILTAGSPSRALRVIVLP